MNVGKRTYFIIYLYKFLLYKILNKITNLKPPFGVAFFYGIINLNERGSVEQLDLIGKVLGLIISLSAVAVIIKKPFIIIIEKLEKLSEKVDAIDEKAEFNSTEITKVSNRQTRSELNSSMQKIELKQQIGAEVTESEKMELDGQLIDYKEHGGNGHMEARYLNLKEKLSK